MVSGSKSLIVVEAVMKLEMSVSFPDPPSIVSNPEPPLEHNHSHYLPLDRHFLNHPV